MLFLTRGFSVPSTIISRAPEPLKVAPCPRAKTRKSALSGYICPCFVFVRHTLVRAVLHISPRREESRVIQLPHHRWRPTSVRELRSLRDTSRRLRLQFLTADVAGACW